MTSAAGGFTFGKLIGWMSLRRSPTRICMPIVACPSAAFDRTWWEDESPLETR
jgi:hypothetical protein